MRKIKLTALLLSIAALSTACTGQSENVTSAASGVTGEITISCYDTAASQAFLEEAARKFEETYPGTKVHIDTFSQMPEIKTSEQEGEQRTVILGEDDPQGRADYISKISTSLMSGEGADLLAMDVLPIDKYVQSGQLENLKEYMDGDSSFQKSDYRENIINGLEFQNGIWFLPLDYSFNYYAYDSSLMADQTTSEFGVNHAFTSNQLIELGKTAYNGENCILSAPVYISDGNGDLFSRMFRENYKEFVDFENQTANFKDGTFEELLKTISDMADQGYIAKGLRNTTDTGEYRESAENPTDRYLFKTKNNFSLVKETYPDPDLALMVSTSMVDNGIETDDEIGGMWSDEGNRVPFTYEQAYGINSNSKNKETAWVFLKFLLSYEIQSSPSMSLLSLPVHNEARMAKAESLYGMLLTETGELDEAQRQALNAYTDAVEVMSDQINGYTVRDTTIEDMVIKEAGYYFDGSKTADQVAQVLQNKVELYLNE